MLMTKRHVPPCLRSNVSNVLEKPSGPHQRARCSGPAKARKTFSCGASMSRVWTNSRSVAASGFTAVDRDADEPVARDSNVGLDAAPRTNDKYRRKAIQWFPIHVLPRKHPYVRRSLQRRSSRLMAQFGGAASESQEDSCDDNPYGGDFGPRQRGHGA
jgi:hypothetical protein